MFENSCLLLSWHDDDFHRSRSTARSSPEEPRRCRSSEGRAACPGATNATGTIPIGLRMDALRGVMHGLRRAACFRATEENLKCVLPTPVFCAIRRSTGRSETSGLVYPDERLAQKLAGHILGDAGWSSPVARQAHNLKVVGSNPAPATN